MSASGQKALPLTEHGLLSEGVHDLTLSQLEMTFGRFQRSDRRAVLFARLRRFVDELAATGWQVELIVNGSFVMPSVDEPDDIDLLLVMPEGWDFGSDPSPFQYNLLSKKRVKRLYGFDMAVAPANSLAREYWIDFYQGIKEERSRQLGLPIDLKKGIVRLSR